MNRACQPQLSHTPRTDFPLKQLLLDGSALHRQLRSRHVPLEKNALRLQQREIEKEALERFGYRRLADAELEASAQERHTMRKAVAKLFYERTYSWKSINFDAHKSLVYAFGRSSLEYGSIYRVFNEISSRDPQFTPRSFFDFGAGVGTGTWAAAAFWKNSLYEYFAVDTSREMNTLSDLILREGDENKHMTLKNVYYRQFLPASNEVRIS